MDPQPPLPSFGRIPQNKRIWYVPHTPVLNGKQAWRSPSKSKRGVHAQLKGVHEMEGLWVGCIPRCKISVSSCWLFCPIPAHAKHDLVIRKTLAQISRLEELIVGLAVDKL